MMSAIENVGSSGPNRNIPAHARQQQHHQPSPQQQQPSSSSQEPSPPEHQQQHGGGAPDYRYFRTMNPMMPLMSLPTMIGSQELPPPPPPMAASSSSSVVPNEFVRPYPKQRYEDNRVYGIPSALTAERRLKYGDPPPSSTATGPPLVQTSPINLAVIGSSSSSSTASGNHSGSGRVEEFGGVSTSNSYPHHQQHQQQQHHRQHPSGNGALVEGGSARISSSAATISSHHPHHHQQVRNPMVGNDFLEAQQQQTNGGGGGGGAGGGGGGGSRMPYFPPTLDMMGAVGGYPGLNYGNDPYSYSRGLGRNYLPSTQRPHTTAGYTSGAASFLPPGPPHSSPDGGPSSGRHSTSAAASAPTTVSKPPHGGGVPFPIWQPSSPFTQQGQPREDRGAIFTSIYTAATLETLRASYREVKNRRLQAEAAAAAAGVPCHSGPSHMPLPPVGPTSGGSYLNMSEFTLLAGLQATDLGPYERDRMMRELERYNPVHHLPPQDYAYVTGGPGPGGVVTADSIRNAILQRNAARLNNMLTVRTDLQQQQQQQQQQRSMHVPASPSEGRTASAVPRQRSNAVSEQHTSASTRPRPAHDTGGELQRSRQPRHPRPQRTQPLQPPQILPQPVVPPPPHQQQRPQQQQRSALETTVFRPNVFVRGSLIAFSNGVQKCVEDIMLEDFLLTASLSPDVRLTEARTRRITPRYSNSAPDATKQVLVCFTYDQREGALETAIDYPFFVTTKGWASFSPERTYSKYGLQSSVMEVGDVFMVLVPRHLSAEENLRDGGGGGGGVQVGAISPAAASPPQQAAAATATQSSADAGFEPQPPPPPPNLDVINVFSLRPAAGAEEMMELPQELLAKPEPADKQDDEESLSRSPAIQVDDEGGGAPVLLQPKEEGAGKRQDHDDEEDVDERSNKRRLTEQLAQELYGIVSPSDCKPAQFPVASGPADPAADTTE